MNDFDLLHTVLKDATPSGAYCLGVITARGLNIGSDYTEGQARRIASAVDFAAGKAIIEEVIEEVLTAKGLCSTESAKRPT